MKLKKTMLAAAMSLGFVGAASAQCTIANSTQIFVTGSTAFRGATINALEACLNSGFIEESFGDSTTPAPFRAEQTSKYNTIYGMLTADSTCVIIRCAWSGSEAGYHDLVACATLTESFEPVDTTYPTASADSTSTVTLDATKHAVDIAMADTSQAFAQPVSRSPALANCCNAGIIPFKWLKNAQTSGDIAANPMYGRLTGVTHAQLRTCILNASKGALFTGNDADQQFVYVAGRDNQSGTRANVLLDLGFSVTTPVKQTILSQTTPPTLGALGNGGQASGGTLATTMKETGSLSTADTINGGTGWIAIAYMGAADAANAEAGGAVDLTLDGVAETDAAVQNGQYSYFGYENCCLSPCNTTSTEAGKLWTCMCTKWTASGITTTGFEIQITTMNAIKGTPPSTIVDSADPVHF